MTGACRYYTVVDDRILQLVGGQKALIRTAQNVFSTAEKASDQVTIDLLTQCMQVHEKMAWMLRSRWSRGYLTQDLSRSMHGGETTHAVGANACEGLQATRRGAHPFTCITKEQ